eukprot:SAG31_NODE_1580_length_7835_cov_4.074457_1_plen_229_part_00
MPPNQSILDEVAGLRAENARLRGLLEVAGVADDGGAAEAAAKAVPARTAGCEGTYGGIYADDWLTIVRPLYDQHMGVENMGPLLYTIVRFTKRTRLLEVGAGYTTLYILQALADNDDELAAIAAKTAAQQLDQHAGPDAQTAEDKGWYIREQLGREDSEASLLHCLDNEEHDVFNDNGGIAAVKAAATALGLAHKLALDRADAFEALAPMGEPGAGMAEGEPLLPQGA